MRGRGCSAALSTERRIQPDPTGICYIPYSCLVDVTLTVIPSHVCAFGTFFKLLRWRGMSTDVINFPIARSCRLMLVAKFIVAEVP